MPKWNIPTETGIRFCRCTETPSIESPRYARIFLTKSLRDLTENGDLHNEIITRTNFAANHPAVGRGTSDLGGRPFAFGLAFGLAAGFGLGPAAKMKMKRKRFTSKYIFEK